jgi:hypothetical protein
MMFIVGVTLLALLVIGLGALGALALLLQTRLRAAQEEIETLRARLAAPTVWEGLGAEWSEAQALTADIVSRPLASAILPSPDFAAPRAWLVDPPEPGGPALTHPQPIPSQTGFRRGRSVIRSLNAAGLQSSLFPAWTADAGLGKVGPEEPSIPVPGAAIGAALLGVYALAAAAGGLFGWPWLATMTVLVVLGGLMIAGFWRAERSLGVSVGVGMAGAAPWIAALAGAPAGVIIPCAGAAAAMAALWGMGRRAPALTWTAAALTGFGALAGAGLTAADIWTATPAFTGALVLALLALLGLVKAGVATEAAVRRPAGALHATALAGLAAGALAYGVTGPFGGWLALMVAISAAAARGPGRDFSLVTAWFAGSIGLFALSGDPAAAVAMTPAATLMGAVFFAAAASRAPNADAHGVVPFALASAGVVTAALVSGAGGLGFAAGAALLTLLFVSAAQARGGLQACDWRYWPLTLSAALAVSQALGMLAAPPVAAALIGLCALCVAMVAARGRAGALGAAASVLGLFAAMRAFEAVSLTPLALAGWAGAALVIAALLAGAWMASERSVNGWRIDGAAPIAGFILGASALALIVALPVVILIAAGHRFGLVGAMGAFWLLCALAFRAGGGADSVARAASGPVALAGLACCAWAWVGPANPWWGAMALPLPAGAAQAALLAGGLAPAGAAAALAWTLDRDGRPRLSLALALAAGVGALIWAALALRVLAFGPAALQTSAFAPLEMLGFTAAIAVAGAALLMIGRTAQRLEHFPTPRAWPETSEAAQDTSPERIVSLPADSVSTQRALAARRAGLALIGLAALKLVALDLHASGLTPALAATILSLLLLAALIAQRDRLAEAWRG